jgi:hemolysin activation/secretion protein
VNLRLGLPLLLPRLLLLTGALFITGSIQAQTGAPESAQPVTEPRFDILAYVVEGDTVLGTAAIERAVYPFLGPGKTAADAEGARKALEKAYQDAGFLSVNVVLPAQRVDNAHRELRLQVAQAPVDRLRITGAQFSLPSRIREALPSLAPGVVPNFNDMQEELGQLSRASADREITPIIAAADRPGAMNVELKVQDKLPLHYSVELNNKQSQNTRAGRLEASINYDNLFQRGHSIGLNWFYSPYRPREANILSLAYQLPLGGPGDRLSLSVVHSDSNTPTPLGGATVSRGDTLRLRWRDALPGLDGLDHALAWGITVRSLQDSNQSVAGFTVAAPSLRYPTFNIGYELDLSGPAVGDVAGRSTRLQADLTVSLSGLSGRNVDCYGAVQDQFGCKRSGAQPGFQVLGLGLTHREPFGGWSLNTRLQAQLADAPLIPSEQVVYGGFDSVRGYDEGEQAGDLGAALRLELQTPGWAPRERFALRALAFYDRATVRKLEPLPSEQATAHIASAGLGLTLESSFGLRASLYWAHILPRGGNTNGRRQRWEFALRQAF